MSRETSKNTSKILNASMDLFKEKGYNNVSVNEICKKAGIQRCSFYNLFSNKDDIIIYIVSNLQGDYKGTLEEFIATDDELQRIWLLYYKYLDMAIKLGPEMVGVLCKLEIDNRLGLIHYIEQYKDWFIALVKECQKKKIIKNPLPAEDIFDLSAKLSYALTFQWSISNGAFDIKDESVKMIEKLYLIDY